MELGLSEVQLNHSTGILEIVGAMRQLSDHPQHDDVVQSDQSEISISCIDQSEASIYLLVVPCRNSTAFNWKLLFCPPVF